MPASGPGIAFICTNHDLLLSTKDSQVMEITLGRVSQSLTLANDVLIRLGVNGHRVRLNSHGCITARQGTDPQLASHLKT